MLNLVTMLQRHGPGRPWHGGGHGGGCHCGNCPQPVPIDGIEMYIFLGIGIIYLVWRFLHNKGK